MSSVVNLDIAKRVDVVCRKGDTFSLAISITDSEGNVQDLSIPDPYTAFKMEVRKADYKNVGYSGDPVGDENDNIILSTEDAALDATKRINYSSDAQGNLAFTVSSDIMETRTAGMYVYDIESIKADGTVQTWIFGTFRINEDVSV